MRKLKISHFLEKGIQSLLRRGLFCKILTLWAYNFGIVQRKNPIFIKDSVKQIKKWLSRKKPFVLAALSGKARIFRRKQGKMLFSNSKKIHYN
jgi:hypothetical protein